ncbi:MAG: DUF86 domain-containing protein [Muribaculaceae bacterium]|nr:DUF86 domain-containing protein [Muribaculaceae bacterium]
MESKYSESGKIERMLLTLYSVSRTIENLIEWNKDVVSAENYYNSPGGMQLLAANCTLITAIGEGINRINRLDPTFLNTNFPDIPWIDIIGMRNRIAHGYFELDADIVLDTVKTGIPPLQDSIQKAIELCKSDP